MKRGDPRLPPAEQIAQVGLADWGKRLVIRLYDRFREIDADVDRVDTFRAAVPASLTLTTGTSTSTVSDLTTMLDGNVYTINEATGVPGFDLECIFAGVQRIKWVASRFWYAGLSTHAARVQLYNYRTAAYDTLITQEGDALDYTLRVVPVLSDQYYISAGAAKVRFYHTESGSAGHSIAIDWVGLVN